MCAQAGGGGRGRSLRGAMHLDRALRNAAFDAEQALKWKRDAEKEGRWKWRRHQTLRVSQMKRSRVAREEQERRERIARVEQMRQEARAKRRQRYAAPPRPAGPAAQGGAASGAASSSKQARSGAGEAEIERLRREAAEERKAAERLAALASSAGPRDEFADVETLDAGMGEGTIGALTQALCSWSGVDPSGNRLICLNPRFRHPATGKLLRRCPWHVTSCCSNHEDPRGYIFARKLEIVADKVKEVEGEAARRQPGADASALEGSLEEALRASGLRELEMEEEEEADSGEEEEEEGVLGSLTTGQRAWRREQRRQKRMEELNRKLGVKPKGAGQEGEDRDDEDEDEETDDLELVGGVPRRRENERALVPVPYVPETESEVVYSNAHGLCGEHYRLRFGRHPVQMAAWRCPGVHKDPGRMQRLLRIAHNPSEDGRAGQGQREQRERLGPPPPTQQEQSKEQSKGQGKGQAKGKPGPGPRRGLGPGDPPSPVPAGGRVKGGKAVDKAALSGANRARRGMTCAWRGKDDSGRAWHCTNAVLQLPDGSLSQRCAWHHEKCVLWVQSSAKPCPPKVEVPNQYAMCLRHHRQRRGEEPREVEPWAVPGAELAAREKARDAETEAHPLAPSRERVQGTRRLMVPGGERRALGDRSGTRGPKKRSQALGPRATAAEVGMARGGVAAAVKGEVTGRGVAQKMVVAPHPHGRRYAFSAIFRGELGYGSERRRHVRETRRRKERAARRQARKRAEKEGRSPDSPVTSRASLPKFAFISGEDMVRGVEAASGPDRPWGGGPLREGLGRYIRRRTLSRRAAHEAATVLQALARGVLVRKRARALVRGVEASRRERAAVIAQRFIRGHVTRVRVYGELRDLVLAARLVQRVWRGHQGRRRYWRLRRRRGRKLVQRLRLAWWGVHRVRSMIRQRRLERAMVRKLQYRLAMEDRMAAQVTAARAVQRLLRRWRKRKADARRRLAMLRASIAVQQTVRAWMRRRHSRLMAAERRRWRENAEAERRNAWEERSVAAIQIQRRWRGVLGRRWGRVYLRQLHDAAAGVQKLWKGMTDRRRVRDRRAKRALLMGTRSPSRATLSPSPSSPAARAVATTPGPRSPSSRASPTATARSPTGAAAPASPVSPKRIASPPTNRVAVPRRYSTVETLWECSEKGTGWDKARTENASEIAAEDLERRRLQNRRRKRHKGGDGAADDVEVPGGSQPWIPRVPWTGARHPVQELVRFESRGCHVGVSEEDLVPAPRADEGTAAPAPAPKASRATRPVSRRVISGDGKKVFREVVRKPVKEGEEEEEEEGAQGPPSGPGASSSSSGGSGDGGERQRATTLHAASTGQLSTVSSGGRGGKRRRRVKAEFWGPPTRAGDTPIPFPRGRIRGGVVTVAGVGSSGMLWKHPTLPPPPAPLAATAPAGGGGSAIVPSVVGRAGKAAITGGGGHGPSSRGVALYASTPAGLAVEHGWPSPTHSEPARARSSGSSGSGGGRNGLFSSMRL